MKVDGEYKNSCNYTKFSGVFKPLSGVLDEMHPEEVYNVMQECLGGKKPTGLVSLAFSNKIIGEGIKILDLNKQEIIQPFSEFPNGVERCERTRYILNELQNYIMTPWSLMTDMSIPCCEKNAQLNGTFYEF